MRSAVVGVLAAAFSLSVAHAEAATVTTGPPTNIAARSMTFDWAYNGPDVSYSSCKRVRYRTGNQQVDTNYGACTQGKSSLTVTGLQPNTKYEFQAIAAGVSECDFYCYGELRTFRTLAVLPPTLGVQVASTSDGGVTVSVQTDSELTDCWAELGTTPSYGRRIQLSSCTPDEATTHLISGLDSATLYNLRVGGRNTVGEGFSENVQFTTTAAADPETLFATKLEPFSATLKGRIHPRGAAGSFHFDFGLDTQYGLKTATYPFPESRSSINVEAPTSVALIPGREYHFRLVASNPYGSWAGKDRVFTTPRTSGGATPSGRCRAAKKAERKARAALKKARQAKRKGAVARASKKLARAKRSAKRAC